MLTTAARCIARAVKEPKSREIGNDDMFSFNDDFQSKLFKIKIGLVAATRDSEPQQQETREKVEEDRKPQIDAAIVRVMKVSPVGTAESTP
jgi:cullin 3